MDNRKPSKESKRTKAKKFGMEAADFLISGGLTHLLPTDRPGEKDAKKKKPEANSNVETRNS